MSNKIFHIELATTDRAASANFFSQLFGWNIETIQPMDYVMARFPEGDTGLAFSPVDGETPEGDVLVYVDVEDVDATVARAKELGASILLEKYEIPTVGWMTIIGEPGGNRIAAMQGMPE